jgi:hypothetical protein
MNIPSNRNYDDQFCYYLPFLFLRALTKGLARGEEYETLGGDTVGDKK